MDEAKGSSNCNSRKEHNVDEMAQPPQKATTKALSHDL
jgi:hypothetical protein